MKTCSKCNDKHPDEEFASNGWCKPCYREYFREYYQENKNRLNEYKKERRRLRRKDPSVKFQNRSLVALKEDLQAALDTDKECQYCEEQDQRCIKFMADNITYTWDDAVARMDNNQKISLICLNCEAKEVHVVELEEEF